MDRVLGLPELLQNIFGVLDLPSNAANARVCKQWSDIALEMLWMVVNNPYFLFNNLAPLRKTVEGPQVGHYEFERLPSSNDWKRFMKYGTKVHYLSFQKAPPRPLLPSVLETIARTRTTLNFLPSLRFLRWEVNDSAFCNLGIIFMNASIKTFIFSPPIDFMSQSPHFFFDEIGLRMPYLTDVDIQTAMPILAIEPEMVSLIAQLQKLKKITLPQYYLTTKTTEALSYLPDLVTIQLPLALISDTRDRPFTPNLTERAFPALLNLSMMNTFHIATRFLNSPINLTKLYVASWINETPPSIHSLISSVSENCQSLTEFYLVSYRGRNSVLEDATQFADYDMTIEVLKPLLKLSKLQAICLRHKYPFTLNQKDIELLACSWPSLKGLDLNNTPVHHYRSTLTLDALVPFAKHCPELETLCLFVDASSDNELLSQVDLIPFQNLQLLLVGASIITKTESVAICLSGILPLKCDLFPFLYGKLPYINVSKQLRDRWNAWNKVNDLLPMLRIARMQERDRTRYLLLGKDSKVEPTTVIPTYPSH